MTFWQKVIVFFSTATKRIFLGDYSSLSCDAYHVNLPSTSWPVYMDTVHPATGCYLFFATNGVMGSLPLSHNAPHSTSVI